MVWYRSPKDYFFGTLTSAAAISDTTLTSADFANLAGGLYNSNFVLPLELHDPSTKLYEVVWVTAHTASATTVTVERAKEGTTARAWAAGTQIVCAPTQRDGQLVTARADLPADGHTGQMAVLSDEGAVVQRTFAGRWEPSIGVARPSDFGKRADTTAIPNSGVLVMRGDRHTGNTNASGFVTATFNSPFPNQCLRVIPTWVGGGTTNYFNIGIQSYTASGVTVFLYRGDTGATASGAGVSITFDYLAVGY